MKIKYLNSEVVRRAFDAGSDYDDICLAVADELAELEKEYERDQEYDDIVDMIDKYNERHKDRLMLSRTTSTPCINNSTTFTLKYDADDAAIRKFVESLK